MPAPSKYYPRNEAAAAKPTRNIFDPWNSSSTGHQRDASRLSGSTSWRDSRTAKLGEQFSAAGRGGGKRISDAVGAGSEGFRSDGRLDNGFWTRGASGLRDESQKSILECLAPTAKVVPVVKPGRGQRAPKEEPTGAASSTGGGVTDIRQGIGPTEKVDLQGPARKQIFRNLNFYINGSTYPVVSDHKLKRMLVEHGGRLSLGLGRKSVTHVILGTSSGAASKRGAPNGLAGGKMHKEITAVRGASVKFVGVEWVVESIKTGQKLPESRFAEHNITPDGQQSVRRCWERINRPR